MGNSGIVPVVGGGLSREQIELLKRTFADRSHLRDRLDIPADIIRELYTERQMSTLEIGKLLGVSKKTIRFRMIEYGIPRRSLREAFSVSPTHTKNKPRCASESNWWRGGTRIKTGYKMIKAKDHPDADSEGYVFEHRLVAEGMVGRRLTENEIVHHVNGDRLDNHPENLRITSRSEHMSMHSREYWASQREGAVKHE